MHNSKLVNTLKMFSREELYYLNDFLHSPYFISALQRREQLPLFQYIISFYGNWEHPDLEKSKIIDRAFSGMNISEGKLNKIMSALLKNTQKFVAVHFKTWKEDPIQDMVGLISFFRNRGAFKAVHHYLEKAKKNLGKIPTRGKQYYYDDFLIGGELFQSYLANAKQRNLINYQTLFQPLDAYYLLNKLEQACFLLSIKRFIKPLDFEQISAFLDAVKPIYEKDGLLELPLVDIYYRAYELLKKDKNEETNYWDLKALIDKHESIIPPDSLSVLHGLLRNFIIERYNFGGKHLLEEIFNLHRAHLEKGSLSFKNGILPSVFKNIISMGLRVKSYDWVFQFLNEYKDKIEGTTRPQEVYDYNLAVYHFARKSYEEALELLHDQYEDIFYKIAAKRLELKIYYETNSEILDAKMDAFKVYIFRLSSEMILDHKRSSNNHFIDFLRQVRNPKTAYSPERVTRLIKRIEESQFITEKDWLLEKLAAF